jgi:hypothetical protein
MITRKEILASIRSAIEPLEFVHAMWEGGAAAFSRVDEWSDIDLQIDADDGRADDVIAIIERALPTVDRRFEIPRPTWHGHAQVFLTFEDASPFLMLDLVVIEHSSADKFQQRRIHGTPVVHFDKSGVTAAPAFDEIDFAEKVRRRVGLLRDSFDLFQTLTLKELNRGNLIEAVSYYQGHTLRPLVEALRILHLPERYNFHTRYVYYELPADVVAELERLFLPRDADDLRRCHARAGEMFHATIDQIG